MKKMEAAVQHFESSIESLHIGRAHPGLLNGIKIKYYGSLLPINQLANISAANSRLLIIQPFDPTSLVEIEKTIKQSNLNLNPQKAGQTLHVAIPGLTGERQKQISKHAAALAEMQRVAIRNIRREARKKNAIDEKTLETLTAQYIEKIDQTLTMKVIEIEGLDRRWG